jgi:hypothetical protein
MRSDDSQKDAAMIPSDHFVRYYNEVFKALEQRGRGHLAAYWASIGELQKRELAERFRDGGLQACCDYWARILKEENCVGRLDLTPDYFELRMERCPSLLKVLDNDATPCEHYCDHCMGWIRPVMEAAGLFAAMDVESRSEPHCVLRVFADRDKMREFERRAMLLPFPPQGSEG